MEQDMLLVKRNSKEHFVKSQWADTVSVVSVTVK